MKNKHIGMDLHKLWFKPREFNKLVNAVEHNEKEIAFEILADMNKRSDLK